METEPDDLVVVMRAYQAGELQAFETLYAALAPDVRRFFAASALERAVADDLLQQTFLEIHRARRSYTPPAPVRPWIFGIARNVRRRHRRASLHRARLEDDRAADAIERASVEARDVAGIAVRDALEQVPASRRRAWILHHVHGLGFEEIGGRLGIGAGAAKLRSSRAMRTLRALLGVRRRDGDD